MSNLLLLKPAIKSYLTKRDLFSIESRIKAIESTIEICHPVVDSDILDNLEAELSTIIEKLEKPKTKRSKKS